MGAREKPLHCATNSWEFLFWPTSDLSNRRLRNPQMPMSHPKGPVQKSHYYPGTGPTWKEEGGSSGQVCLTEGQCLESKWNSSQFCSECALHHSTAGFSRWPGMYSSIAINILQHRGASWEGKSLYCQKSNPSKTSLASTKFAKLMDKTHLTLQSQQICRFGPETLNSTTDWKYHVWFILSIYFW